MARIPDRAPKGAPRTATPSRGAGGFGDLGLGAVGEALDRSADALRRQAAKRAEEAFAASSAEFMAEYQSAAAAYDGRQPGFARMQLARFDGVMEATAEALDEDARRQFQRGLPQWRAAQAAQATALEGQRAGGVLREGRARALRIDTLGRIGQLRVGYAEDKRGLLDGFDGSQAGLSERGLAALDARYAAALEGAPPEVAEILGERYAALRGDEQMALMSVERHAMDAHLATTTARAAETTVAAVVTDPGQYDAAVRDLQAIAAELPAAAQAGFLRDNVQAAAMARFQGLLTSGEWEQVFAELESGDWDETLGAEGKARVAASASQSRAVAGFDPVTVERELARQAADRSIQSHVASILHTGQPTPLTAAEVRRQAGPVAEAAFVRQEALAYDAYRATRGLAALPPAEQAARVEALKPQGAEPDFAERLAVYETAVQTLTGAREQQRTDPAQATQANADNAALWRAFASEPSARAAAAWAEDTLSRQDAMGVPETARRLLPSGYAREVALRVKTAEGADTLGALTEASALVTAFGGHEGLALTDLTRAGMSARDAAVIGLADGNPVALADYARARNRGNVGLSAQMRRDTRAAVVDRLAPLQESWAMLPGGQAGFDAFVSGVEMVAATHVADGMSPRAAARAASEVYMSNFVFRDGWRAPRWLASQQVEVVAPQGWRGRDPRRTGQENARFATPDQRTRMSGVEAVELGAYLTVRDLVVGGDGAGLEDAGDEPHLTPAQRRRRAADRVATQGRWVTSVDNSSLLLVVPDRTRPGGVIFVHDAQGRPIRRSFDDLIERAGR